MTTAQTVAAGSSRRLKRNRCTDCTAVGGTRVARIAKLTTCTVYIVIGISPAAERGLMRTRATRPPRVGVVTHNAKWIRLIMLAVAPK
jgi:hypothetical protein